MLKAVADRLAEVRTILVQMRVLMTCFLIKCVVSCLVISKYAAMYTMEKVCLSSSTAILGIWDGSGDPAFSHFHSSHLNFHWHHCDHNIKN